MQFLSLQYFFWFAPAKDEIVIVGLVFFVINFSNCFLDLISDSMTIVQSRRDLSRGSERLQSFTYKCRGIGNITGSLISAVMTQYLDPKWSLFVYSLFGILIIFAGHNLSEEID